MAKTKGIAEADQESAYEEVPRDYGAFLESLVLA